MTAPAAVAAGTVDILADHSVLLAIPAFLPAFAVAGVVIFLAVRDRRRGDPDDTAPDDTAPGDRAPDDKEIR